MQEEQTPQDEVQLHSSFFLFWHKGFIFYDFWDILLSGIPILYALGIFTLKLEPDPVMKN